MTVSLFNKGADEGLVGTPKYACHLATYDESRKKKSLLGVYEFWFRSASNMKKFQRDPWKYVPQFGGFCSWGIATEWKEQGWPWDKDFLGEAACDAHRKQVTTSCIFF